MGKNMSNCRRINLTAHTVAGLIRYAHDMRYGYLYKLQSTELNPNPVFSSSCLLTSDKPGSHCCNTTQHILYCTGQVDIQSSTAVRNTSEL